MIVEAFERLVRRHWDPDTAHSSARIQMTSRLSDAIFEAGFLDMLVPDTAGQFQFDHSALFEIARLCGKALLPLPVGETILARSWAAAAVQTIPAGFWVILGSAAVHGLQPKFRKNSDMVAKAGAASLCVWDGQIGLLQPMEWSDVPRLDPSTWPLRHEAIERAAVALGCARMAGALGRVAELSQQYAAQREQFGRPIAAFQAVQQMLSQLVEELATADAAARLAFASGDFDLPRTAVAGICCGLSAGKVAALAHQIHGAIGMTDEYPLSRYTRAMAAWRLAIGGESSWSIRLAKHALRCGSPNLASWIVTLA